MSDERIATTTPELLAQLDQAIAAIQADGSWVGPPSLSELIAVRANLNSDHLNQVASAAKNKLDRQNEKVSRKAGRDIMTLIDRNTDFRFGPTGAQKAAYGVPPKKVGGTPVPLTQVYVTKIGDGEDPASIALKWKQVKGAAGYQIEWFSDVNMTIRINNDAVSQVEYTIKGLVAKTQYWIRIRAIRGDDHGQWCDACTRVAGI